MNRSYFFQPFLFCALISASINLCAMDNDASLSIASLETRYASLKLHKPSMDISNAAPYDDLIDYIDSCNNLTLEARIVGNQKIASDTQKMAGQASSFVERLINI